MSQNLVGFQIEAAGIGNEVSVRRQIQNDNGPVAITAVATSLGEALAVLQSKMSPAEADAVVNAFCDGYTGERE